jgi:hypothetical protein
MGKLSGLPKAKRLTATRSLRPFPLTSLENSLSPISRIEIPDGLPNQSLRGALSTSTDISSLWSYRKQVASAASVGGIGETKSTDFSGDNFTGTPFPMARSGVRALPDVKEEPNLESSVDLRTPVFPFPTARSGEATLSEEDTSHQQLGDRKSQENQQARDWKGTKDFQRTAPSTRVTSTVFKPMSNGLLDAHAIPSLNFCTTNLLSKLNDALELRRASLGSEYAELSIIAAAEKRKSRSTVMREKYRSLFLSSDDMGMDAEELRHFDDCLTEEMGNENDDGTDQQHEHENVSTVRPLSPSELIDEVERISVPSVSGLAQRLSELLPSLRHYLGDNNEDISEIDLIEKTLIELQDLGKKDGREHLDLSFPGDAEPPIADMTRRANVPKISERPLSVPSPAIAELPGAFSFTNPGRMRSASDSEVDWSKLDSISRIGLSAERCPQRSRSPNGTPRPWNVESSYPWSNSIPLIDISFPTATSPREAFAALPQSKLRQRLSGSSSPNLDDSSPPNAIGLLTLNPTPPFVVTPATVTRRPRNGKRRSRLLGSLSRHVLSGQSYGAATSAIDATSGLATRTNLLHGGDLERSVDPSDRYPTTGFSLPGALVLEDVRSFFSDDGESTCSTTTNRAGRGTRGGRSAGIGPRARIGSFRKRLTTSIRARLPGQANSLHKSVRSTRGHTPACELPTGKAAAAVAAQRLGPVGVGSAPDGTTLPSGVHEATSVSPPEVKAKRLVDRLKVFWWRGSELLRSMSGRGTASNSASAGTSAAEVSGIRRRRGKTRGEASGGPAGARRRPRLVCPGRRLGRAGRSRDPTEEDGWSEDGESMTDWSGTQEYDARATAMARDIGVGVASAFVIRE